MERFYSNGKLLITGEYVILDGALALALPTTFGQSLELQPISSQKIIWNSFDNLKNLWFSAELLIDEITQESNKTDDPIKNRLLQILRVAKQLNPEFLKTGFQTNTYLEFPRNWGLGTSSTLIYNIAKWAKVNPYELLKLTFGGSGYDIACAAHNTPITFQKQADQNIINPVKFNPSFSNHLFFIHLNQKQNSREGIKHYKLNKDLINDDIDTISVLTEKIITCTNLTDFEHLLIQHEEVISKITNLPTVKERVFNDYKGEIKSLGAWGGDFILATGTNDDMSYFKDKGYNTIVPFNDMVK